MKDNDFQLWEKCASLTKECERLNTKIDKNKDDQIYQHGLLLDDIAKQNNVNDD